MQGKRTRSGRSAPIVERFEPELVIASGDLSHRGRPEQHDTAAELLRGLGPPLLCVPGNHDIPYTFPARFTRTWEQFERQWETTEPVYRSERILAVGLNSVRPWRNQSGRLRDAQLARAAQELRSSNGSQLRVAVLHHHLIGAPWRSRKKPVARRNHVLASLVDAGAELIVAGHIHQSTIAERREFEIATGGEHGVAVVGRAGARAAAPAPPRRSAWAPRLRVRRAATAHPHVHVARRRLGAHRRARVRPRHGASRR